MSYVSKLLTSRLRSGLLTIALMLIIAATATAYPNRLWNHRHNPALFSTGNRPVVDVGFSASPSLQNSYLTTDQIFQPTLVIDFEDIYASIGRGGYKVGANLGIGAHLVAHINDIGAGVYVDADNMFRVTLPSGLLGFLADGFEMNTQYTERAQVILRSFIEYGSYASYHWEPYTFGAKIGKYIPLAYTTNGTAEYSFLAEEDGRIEATASINSQLYSAIDLEDPGTIDPLQALTGPGGLKVDLGVVYNPTRNRPLWGLSFTNIPLYAPIIAHGWSYTGSAGAHSDGILDALGSDDELFEVEDPVNDFSKLEDVDRRIFMPFRAGGFYRYSDLDVIDIITHGGITLADPFRVDLGAMVEGSEFPFSIFSLGMGYRDLAWRTQLGFRFDARVVELGLQIGTSSPEFAGILSTRGLSVNFMMAFGY